jgi:hypothetical protein
MFLVECEATLFLVNSFVVFLVDEELKGVLQLISFVIVEREAAHQQSEEDDADVPDVVLV